MANRAAAPPGAKGEVLVQEPERWERTVARRSAEARATIPDIELTAEADIGTSLALVTELPYGVSALLVRACAHALSDVPRANGSYRDGRFELYSRVNVGVTFATEDTYVIPTLFDADRKPLAQCRDELARIAERASAGELSPPELAGATFTLSNVGDLGVASATPVIVPPQAAALAAGAIREVPVIRDRAIVPRCTMTLTLACDHRILYGAHAAGFLMQIKSHLERPSP